MQLKIQQPILLLVFISISIIACKKDNRDVPMANQQDLSNWDSTTIQLDFTPDKAITHINTLVLNSHDKIIKFNPDESKVYESPALNPRVVSDIFFSAKFAGSFALSDTSILLNLLYHEKGGKKIVSKNYATVNPSIVNGTAYNIILLDNKSKAYFNDSLNEMLHVYYNRVDNFLVISIFSLNFSATEITDIKLSKQFTIPCNIEDASDIAVICKKDEYYLSLEKLGAYWIDNNRTLTKIFTNTAFAIEKANDTLLLCSGDGIHISTDNGNSWLLENKDLLFAHSITNIDNNYFTVSNSYLYKPGFPFKKPHTRGIPQNMHLSYIFYFNNYYYSSYNGQSYLVKTKSID